MKIIITCMIDCCNLAVINSVNLIRASSTLTKDLPDSCHGDHSKPKTRCTSMKTLRKLRIVPAFLKHKKDNFVIIFIQSSYRVVSSNACLWSFKLLIKRNDIKFRLLKQRVMFSRCLGENWLQSHLDWFSCKMSLK